MGLLWSIIPSPPTQFVSSNGIIDICPNELLDPCTSWFMVPLSNKPLFVLQQLLLPLPKTCHLRLASSCFGMLEPLRERGRFLMCPLFTSVFALPEGRAAGA
jgi:hypothetical protein